METINKDFYDWAYDKAHDKVHQFLLINKNTHTEIKSNCGYCGAEVSTWVKNEESNPTLHKLCTYCHEEDFEDESEEESFPEKNNG